MIKFHPLFLIVLAFSLWFGYIESFITMFVLVVLHECGHLLAAKWRGWNIYELRLLPFGGELVVDSVHLTSAKDEWCVAFAGPLVNIGLLFLTLAAETWHWINEQQVHYLIEANVTIIIFNLLPIMPLDGGKIVHALLTRWLPYRKVQQIMTHLSIVASACMVLYSMCAPNLSGIHLNLLLIGIFLWLANLFTLRQLPIQFLRFLLQKLNMYENPHISHSFFRPMNSPLPFRTDHLNADDFHPIFKERSHRFVVHDTRNETTKEIDEHQLLSALFRYQPRSR